MRRLLPVGIVLALIGQAEARMHAGPNVMPGGERLRGAIAPLDGGGAFAQPAAAYSLRRLKSTYTGPGIKVRRASDSLTQDIGFLGFTGFTGAPLDVAAAATFCNATSCFIDTWYDQSGAGRHVAQATPAAQPALVFDCNGLQPCARSTSASIFLASASVVWVAGPASFSAVGRRASGTGSCNFIVRNLGRIGANTANDWWLTAFAGGQVDVAATDNVWHAAQGTILGNPSVLRVDAVEVTGNVVMDNAAGTVGVIGAAAATTCDAVEAVIWENYPLAAEERAALQANQKGFWGTP